MSPSVTLSPVCRFPGVFGYTATSLRRFLDGTRRASPVARRILAIGLSLLPRQSVSPLPSGCDDPYGLHLRKKGSASGPSVSRLPVRSLSLRPDDSLAILTMALSIGSQDSVSFLLTIQATGLLTPTLVEPTPTQYASLRWTHLHAGLSRRTNFLF